jgi:hypothetical protein
MRAAWRWGARLTAPRPCRHVGFSLLRTVPRRVRSRGGSAPTAHFASAQAEQTLWQEFRDQGASLNRALNEALRIHEGPAWRIFQVSEFRRVWCFFLCLFHV